MALSNLFPERNLNPKTACLKRREEEKSEEAAGGSKYGSMHGHGHVSASQSNAPSLSLDSMRMSAIVR